MATTVWTVYERVDLEKPGVEVGKVTVDGSDVSVETDSDDLQALIDNLVVTIDGDGTPAKEDDPQYAEAVADSVGRASGWRFFA